MYQIDESSGERLFNQNKTFNKLVNQGPVLGLEFAGNDAVVNCRQSSETLIKMKFPDLHCIYEKQTINLFRFILLSFRFRQRIFD